MIKRVNIFRGRRRKKIPWNFAPQPFTFDLLLIWFIARWWKKQLYRLTVNGFGVFGFFGWFLEKPPNKAKKFHKFWTFIPIEHNIRMCRKIAHTNSVCGQAGCESVVSGNEVMRSATQREALATRRVEKNLELIFSIVTPSNIGAKWPYWWGLSNGTSFDQIWYYYNGANKDLVPKKSQFLVWWNLILNV